MGQKKVWVPDSNRNHDLPNTRRALYPTSCVNIERFGSITELWFCYQKWVKGVRSRMTMTARLASAIKKILVKMSRYLYSRRKVHCVTLRYAVLLRFAWRYVLRFVTLRHIITLLTFQSALFPGSKGLFLLHKDASWSIHFSWNFFESWICVIFLLEADFFWPLCGYIAVTAADFPNHLLIFIYQFVQRRQKHLLSFLALSEEYWVWV